MNRVATQAAALFVLGIITTSNAFADHKRDIDELAYDVKIQSARVAREVHYTFRRTAEYRRLYTCAYNLYCLADRIQAQVHNGCTPGDLRNDVESLDKMFHDLEEGVEKLKDVKSVPVASFEFGRGSSCSIRFGCVNQNHLKRLCRELDCLEETVHALDDLVSGTPALPVPPRQGRAQLPPLPPVPTVPNRTEATRPRPAHVPSRSTRFPNRPSAHRPVFRHNKSGFSFSIVLSK